MNMQKIIPYHDSIKEKVIHFILSILEGEFNHIGIERPDLRDIPTTYQKNNGNFWVALDQDKVIGTVGLFKHGQDYGYIKRMCVDTAYRGKGLAQKLLSAIIDFAKSHNYKNLYLVTSENMVAAQRFYEKEGFEKIETLPDNFPTAGATIFYKMEL